MHQTKTHSISQKLGNSEVKVLSPSSHLSGIYSQYNQQQPSALLNSFVSLYFSLDGQMNMLQVSSYTGKNPRTTNQESKKN